MRSNGDRSRPRNNIDLRSSQLLRAATIALKVILVSEGKKLTLEVSEATILIYICGTKAQRRQLICPRSHRKTEAELGRQLRVRDFP